jgi:P pilus assembly chaperone PapD
VNALVALSACRLALGLGAAALGLGLAAGTGHAEVAVSPTSLLFEGETGTKAITVTNSGKRDQVFRISLVNFRMLPDGRMVRADPPDEDEHFASDMVRFTPHEVALAPGASEVVRLRVQSLRPGEYRTHVLVQQVPDIAALETSPFAHANSVAVDLQAVFGVAVPLIIREGKLPAVVNFSQARLVRTPDGAPAVALRLERMGERSVAGALSLRLDGKEIALYDGFAIYAPTRYRDLLLPLPSTEGSDFGEGQLTAQFQESEDVQSPAAAHVVVQGP